MTTTSPIQINGREFELVIFDHDGVLVDSEILAMTAIQEILADHGLPLELDAAFDMFLGRPFDKVIDHLQSYVPEIDREAVDIRFHTRLFELFVEFLQPIPGIPSLVAALKSRGAALAIASSGTSERVALGISQTGLADSFDTGSIFTKDHVKRGKPDPDVFLLAANSLGIDPARCLVIEDSPHGVQAAKRAGMFVIGLAYRTPAEDLHEADLVMRSAAEVLELVSSTP